MEILHATVSQVLALSVCVVSIELSASSERLHLTVVYMLVGRSDRQRSGRISDQDRLVHLINFLVHPPLSLQRTIIHMPPSTQIGPVHKGREEKGMDLPLAQVIVHIVHLPIVHLEYNCVCCNSIVC